MRLIIGIGAQKCATSWVHAVVGSHPEVRASTPKEVDFFSYHFDHGYRWYLAHFGADPGEAVLFENSPSYFHDPRAPARLAAFCGGARIVALLRDPVARAFSNHLHEVIKGHIPLVSFEEGLRNNPAYLEQGLYATHLERWLEAFPHEQVAIRLAEEIAADPSGESAALYRFAGIDAGHRSGLLAERRNESDRARSDTLRATLRAGGDWARRRGLEEMLLRVKRTGPVSRLLAANRIDLRAEVSPMLVATRHRLLEHFSRDLEVLPALIGRTSLPWPSWREIMGLPAAAPEAAA